MTSNRTSISRDSALEMRRFCASVNFRRAARVVTRHYDAALRTAGITATQLPLLAAIGTGTNASITMLADALDLERSTVSRELDALYRRGLIATASLTPEATAQGTPRLPERAVRRDIPITNSIRRAYAAGTRDSTGRPGRNYWQIRTDYTISARLDPTLRRLDLPWRGGRACFLGHSARAMVAAIFEVA